MTLAAQTTTDAKALLDKTAAVVGNKGGASASFDMSGGDGQMTGSIIIKGDKFYAKTQKVAVWFNGKTQWAYYAASEEVNVSEPTGAQQQLLNPYHFISLYKSGYSMTATKSGNTYEAHLTAQKSDSRIKEAYINVDGSYRPTQIKIRTNKGWTTIKISNFKTGDYADSTFSFDGKNYPNAEVIDLR